MEDQLLEDTPAEKRYKEFELNLRNENPDNYIKKCGDCGRFVKKLRWVAKDSELKKWPLCSECYSNYDDPMCY